MPRCGSSVVLLMVLKRLRESSFRAGYCAAVCLAVLFCPIQVFAQTTTAVSGDTVTLGVGAVIGVRAGMTGRITKQEMVGGQLQSFEIARFEVTQVEASSCAARLTAVGSGWVVESGMEVAFDQPLSPPRANTATVVIRSNVAGDVAYLDRRRLGPTPQRVEVAPGEHTVRVEKNGYEAVDRRITLAAGQETVVTAQLTDARLPGQSRTDPAIGMKFRFIPAGSFEMGSPPSEAERDSDEQQHRVTLTRGYWMGETEVTQGQWRAVMGSNPSHFSSCGESCPVEQVSWLAAVEFANRLSRKAGFEECYRISGERVSLVDLGCGGYRLPTEAEWECAARAGGSHRYAGGDDVSAVGWCDGNSSSRTHPVGQKWANVWGLHDMSGNVWEWVWDTYGDYPSGAVTNPTGPSGGPSRVNRGGSWVSSARDCRSANRGRSQSGNSYSSLGLRLVRTAD